MPGDDLLEMVRLSDLARIGGVGPVFARILCEAGVVSLQELARWSPEELFERLHAVNDERHYTKAIISLERCQALCRGGKGTAESDRVPVSVDRQPGSNGGAT